MPIRTVRKFSDSTETMPVRVRIDGLYADLVMRGTYVHIGDETGARGYFPGVADLYLVDMREGRIGTHYAHGAALVARRIAVYRKARRATLASLPPMAGGSPYADRGTGWHAEGCLCRRCSL